VASPSSPGSTHLILPFPHRKSGLKLATADDGTSEWVRPEDVERCQKEGGALLGKETKVSDEEKVARKTVLSQSKSLRERHSKVVAEAPDADAASDASAAGKGLNDNAHGIDRFGYRVS
jgi:hypothetical protein